MLLCIPVKTSNPTARLSSSWLKQHEHIPCRPPGCMTGRGNPKWRKFNRRMTPGKQMATNVNDVLYERTPWKVAKIIEIVTIKKILVHFQRCETRTEQRDLSGTQTSSQSKDKHIRLTGNSKLSVRVNASVHAHLSLCLALSVSGYLSRLTPPLTQDNWDGLQHCYNRKSNDPKRDG